MLEEVRFGTEVVKMLVRLSFKVEIYTGPAATLLLLPHIISSISSWSLRPCRNALRTSFELQNNR